MTWAWLSAGRPARGPVPVAKQIQTGQWIDPLECGKSGHRCAQHWTDDISGTGARCYNPSGRYSSTLAVNSFSVHQPLRIANPKPRGFLAWSSHISHVILSCVGGAALSDSAKGVSLCCSAHAQTSWRLSGSWKLMFFFVQNFALSRIRSPSPTHPPTKILLTELQITASPTRLQRFLSQPLHVITNNHLPLGFKDALFLHCLVQYVFLQ